MDWNHWPTHCPVQLFLPMHHSGQEPLTNTLPRTTLSTYAPQWTGTTDQHTAQYNSFYLCTTVDWNPWPTHCPILLFLPMHHSGWDWLDNGAIHTDSLTNFRLLTASTVTYFFKGNSPPPPPPITTPKLCSTLVFAGCLAMFSSDWELRLERSNTQGN